MLKLIRERGDEWHSGRVLAAFDGRGVVEVLEHMDGALLMERLVPGTSLSSVIDDGEATVIMADVIRRMSPGPPPESARSVEDLGQALRRYRDSGGKEIPEDLLTRATCVFVLLASSQGPTQLLHGDLHHDNILLDCQRGWLAIDAKGVVGERAYEVGAAFRNPIDHPERFLDRATIERRVGQLSAALSLSEQRVHYWAFVQAVLAAIWELEDDGRLTNGVHWVALASAMDSWLEL